MIIRRYIFSALIGFVMFGQLPDLLSWLGYVIIIGMAVLMFILNNVVSERKESEV